MTEKLTSEESASGPDYWRCEAMQSADRQELEAALAAALAEIERLNQSIRDIYLSTSCRGLTDERD